MAGESAREQAERRWGETAMPSGALWDLSTESEASIGRALEELRTSPGWTVLHDVPWPSHEQGACLDHVVIGPSGVFVIEAKNWTGEITLEGEELLADGWSRADSVRDVATAAQELAGTLADGLAPELVWPVLCFARDEWVSERIGDVLICSRQNVVAQLKTRRHVLDHATVERLAAQLSQAADDVAAADVVESAPEAATELAEPELTEPELDEPELDEPGLDEPEPSEPEQAEPVTEPVTGSVASQPGAGRHGRARRRFMRRSRIAQVIGGLGLLAVVALRPDTLQPVGTFVSDLMVQEAGADDGDPSTKPTAKPKQGKDDTSAGKANDRADGRSGDRPGEKQKKSQRG